MKKSLFISIFAHGFLLTLFWIIPSPKPFRWNTMNIYRVELVDLPVPQSETEMTIKEPKSEPESNPVALIQNTPEKPAKKTESPAPPTPSSRKKKEEIPGAISGGVVIDTKNFPFSYYITLMKNRIHEKWRPPISSVQAEKQKNPILSFQVMKTGNIINIVFEQRSEYFLEDQAALRAICEANPLPPLPAEFPGNEISIRVEFEAIGET
jgi:TonB family protein